MVSLIQNLPSEANCRIWRYENAQDKSFQRASLSRLCYGGNLIVSLQKYNCARKEMELGRPKEIQIVSVWEIQLPSVWKCKAGFCGQVCSRDLSPSYKDKWGQFSFCLLHDKRCYFLVPILKARCNNFLFAIADLFYFTKLSFSWKFNSVKIAIGQKATGPPSLWKTEILDQSY